MSIPLSKEAQVGRLGYGALQLPDFTPEEGLEEVRKDLQDTVFFCLNGLSVFLCGVERTINLFPEFIQIIHCTMLRTYSVMNPREQGEYTGADIFDTIPVDQYLYRVE